ncbi:hypothetical protein DYH09_19385 [bacterium CPR1]|nr:hypothetical protein [bacterium CPR1]
MFVAPARKADWTVLVLLNGNNDLEANVTRDLVELEQVGSTNRVRLVAQLTRGPQELVHQREEKPKPSKLDGDWEGTRRYEVARSPGTGRKRSLESTVISQHDNQDHGQPSTLSDFLRWGVESYPAEHYLVVVGDHGKGFLGTGFDEVHKSTLQMPELRQALEQSGLKPDVLVLDACLMGQLEVAYELKGRAGYLVGSEEIVGRDGLPHVDVLGWLAAHPESTGRELAETMVELAENDQIARMDENRPDAAVQLSALDLGQVEAVRKACDRLAGLLMEDRVPRSTLKYLIGRTQRFNPDSEARPERDFRDLGHFADRLLGSSKVTDPLVRQAAEQLKTELEGLVVRQHNAGDGVEEATGLSVYLPTRYGQDTRPRGLPKEQFSPTWGYPQTQFARGTKWDEMLSWLAA